jgi:hypothetical protein
VQQLADFLVETSYGRTRTKPNFWHSSLLTREVKNSHGSIPTCTRATTKSGTAKKQEGADFYLVTLHTSHAIVKG